MRWLILLCLFCFFHLANAQDESRIDSLKAIVEKANQQPELQLADTLVCQAYLRWGEQLYRSNPDTALIIWKRALTLANRNLENKMSEKATKGFLALSGEAMNNVAYILNIQGKLDSSQSYYNRSLEIFRGLNATEQIATAYTNIGYLFTTRGEIAKALDYYHKGLKMTEKLEDKKAYAHALNNLGVLYYDQGDIENALVYLHKCLKIDEELGNETKAANTINNIGSIYEYQGDIEKALEYYQKSLALQEAGYDKQGMSVSYNNIGLLYHKQGDPECTDSEKECRRIGNEKAYDYLQKSLALKEEIHDKQGIAGTLNNLALVLDDNGESDERLEYYLKSLSIYQEIGDKNGTSVSMTNIGKLYLKRGRMKKAMEYGVQSIRLAQELGFPKNIRDAAWLLSLVHRKLDMHREALEMYELHIQMRDSIVNESTQKATIRQQTKYEFEKAQLVKEQNEKEAARLAGEATSRRNNLQYSVILISILALFGGVLSLGFINVSERAAEGIIFFSFLILFEFFLVLADPYIDGWSGGAPGIKLLFNAGIAALIFPAHAFFETKLKSRLAVQDE